MTAERWLPVIGCEGRYEVSDLGRVRSLPRRGTRGGILIPHAWRSCTGRIERIALKLGKGTNPKGVHLIVLEAFVGPRPPGHEGAHDDGNPENNRLTNLAWKTPKENAEDKVRHGTACQAERSHLSKLKEADVVEIRKAEVSRRILAKRFGVTVHNIGFIQRGRTWKRILPPIATGDQP